MPQWSIDDIVVRHSGLLTTSQSLALEAKSQILKESKVGEIRNHDLHEIKGYDDYCR